MKLFLAEQVDLDLDLSTISHESLRTHYERLSGNKSIILDEKEKEQAETLERVRSGQVDIIIGTHRLIQKDVKYENLGLVIIDENNHPVGAMNMHDLLKSGVL